MEVAVCCGEFYFVHFGSSQLEEGHGLACMCAALEANEAAEAEPVLRQTLYYLKTDPRVRLARKGENFSLRLGTQRVNKEGEDATAEFFAVTCRVRVEQTNEAFE